jgi:hypothetical protein
VNVYRRPWRVKRFVMPALARHFDHAASTLFGERRVSVFEGNKYPFASPGFCFRSSSKRWSFRMNHHPIVLRA